MAATAVRVRAACALGLAGLLVLPALLVLPPVPAALLGFLVALAVVLPEPIGPGLAAAASEG